MRIPCAVLAVGLMFFGLAMGSCYAVDPPGEVNLEDVKAAWKKRQDRARTGRFISTEEQTDIKGSLTWLVEHDKDKVAKSRKKRGLPPLPNNLVLPPATTKMTVHKEVWFDGNKVRTVSRGNNSFSVDSMAYRLNELIGVFDGDTIMTTLTSDGALDTKDVPVGHIEVARAPAELRFPSVRPILMAYRSFSPSLARFDPERLVLTKRTAMIDGRRCLEIEHLDSAANKRSKSRIWIDPSRDHLITRTLSITDGFVKQRMDIRYKEHAEQGWVPSGWEVRTFSKEDGLDQVHVGTVTEAEINAPIEARVFQLTFPKGSMVIDEKENTTSLVMPDGNRRRLSNREQRLSYAQLTGLEPVPGGLAPRRSLVWMTVGGLGGVALLLSLSYAIYRYRNRLKTS